MNTGNVVVQVESSGMHMRNDNFFCELSLLFDFKYIYVVWR